MTFGWANSLSGKHLAVPPADLLLFPPESYLYVQDALILFCGATYTGCYACGIKQVYTHGVVLGPIEYLQVFASHFPAWLVIADDILATSGLTLAYELCFAFTVPSTWLGTVAFLTWFCFDTAFVSSELHVTRRGRRKVVAGKIVSMFTAGIWCVWMLYTLFPDERQQLVAYWTGIILQLPVGWGLLYSLWTSPTLKGHSMSIW